MPSLRDATAESPAPVRAVANAVTQWIDKLGSVWVEGQIAHGGYCPEAVADARRELACDSLRDPRTSIQTAAEQSGFQLRSAFHRAFKRWTGETPMGFRRRVRSHH